MNPSYTQNSSGTYSPINIVAVDGIKCAQCSELHPFSLFKNHAKKHLPEQLAQSSVHHKKPTKINFDKLLKDDKDKIDIFIKSILPDQIPKAEDKKREIFQLMCANPEVRNSHTTEEQGLEVKKVEMKAKWRETVGAYGEEWRNKEKQSCQLKIQKRVSFPTQRIKFHKKNYTHYLNQHHDNFFFDHKIQKQKVNKHPKKESKVYEFSRIPVLKEIKDPHQQTNKLKVVPFYSATKKPKIYPKISTISIQKPSRGIKEAAKLTIYEKNASDTATQAPSQNFQCPSCHGFYCSTCKSTIPPAFRPVQNNFMKEERTEIGKKMKNEFLKVCQGCN